MSSETIGLLRAGVGLGAGEADLVGSSSGTHLSRLSERFFALPIARRTAAASSSGNPPSMNDRPDVRLGHSEREDAGSSSSTPRRRWFEVVAPKQLPGGSMSSLSLDNQENTR